MNSPLGQYAQHVAVLVVLATIGAWGFAVLTGDVSAVGQLDIWAGACFGAVLGSAATVNGYKRDQNSIQKRLDAAGIPPSRLDPGA